MAYVHELQLIMTVQCMWPTEMATNSICANNNGQKHSKGKITSIL